MAGFHYDTWAVILIQAFGGLLTGVVIKYAGNVLKGFANAIAILTTCFISIPAFDYRPTHTFWIGLVGVCVATSMYSAPSLDECVQYVTTVAAAASRPKGYVRAARALDAVDIRCAEIALREQPTAGQ